jgi:hypothetical protein
LNGSFDAIVSTSQVGLDEAPTQALIDTWVADCKLYTATVAAWKTMQAKDLADFNALLGKNNQRCKYLRPRSRFRRAPLGRQPRQQRKRRQVRNRGF